MGICVEPLEDAMALWDPFEQFKNALEAHRRMYPRGTGTA
jgi:hypothetical protein